MKYLYKIESYNYILIVGSGSSIGIYSDSILEFIEKNAKIKTIGINCMNNLTDPYYHLWVNRKRFSQLGGCISPKSRMLFGKNMPKNIIRKHFRGKYNIINFEDQDDLDISVSHDIIKGDFKTAGALSIVLAHFMGAENIYVVGMDGYTLYNKKDLIEGNKHQHCYGSGYTDDADWNNCLLKDKKVYENLRRIYDYGINFSILTPTVFEKFYDPSILKIY